MNSMWLAAGDAIEAALAGGSAARVTLVLDDGVADTPVVARVQGWLDGLGPRPVRVREHRLAATCPSLDDDLRAELADEQPAVTVVIGGGAVLDRVKLATLPGPPTSRWADSRSGLVLPPPGPARPLPLVAVPTTLGTGSEASAVAVASRGHRRVLVMDRRLRPTAYAHDPAAYLTLPHAVLRHGLAEILSRLLGPYVGDPAGDPLTDALCLAALERTVRAGDRLVTALDRDSRPSPADLSELARIGAFAHSDHVQRPHHPWSVKLWALANESCAVTGVAKMPATEALWPAFWSAIRDGDTSLGSIERLHRAWLVVRSAHDQPLPSDPGDGIAHLLSHWGAVGAAHLQDVSIRSLVDRVVRAWGAGLPMYHGVSASSIDDVLMRCVRAESSGNRPTPTPTRPGFPSSLATH